MVLLRFVPHFLLLFGVLADAFTYEGVYWTGTMVGVLSTFIAPMLDSVAAGFSAMIGELMKKRGMATAVSGGGILGSLAMKGGADDYAGCSLMSGALPTSMEGVPQTLTVTASILAYYIFDLVLNMSLIDAAGAIVAALLLFGGQTMAISGCVSSPSRAAAIAGVYGIIIGGSMYGGISTFAPSYLPTSVLTGSITTGGGAQGRGVAGPGRRGLGMSAGADGVSGNGGAVALAAGGGTPGQQATCPR
jgi:hypothetical protein